MEKFIEFVTTETNDVMELFVRLENRNLVHVRSYDFLYEGDYQFYRDGEGRFNEIYCHHGVSYIIRDGKLFEFTHDMYGVNHEDEITLPMLLACSN